jgi:hypothetical protein
MIETIVKLFFAFLAGLLWFGVADGAEPLIAPAVVASFAALDIILYTYFGEE